MKAAEPVDLTNAYAWKSALYIETARDHRHTAQIKVDIDPGTRIRSETVKAASRFLAGRKILVTMVEVYKTRPNQNSYHIRIWISGRYGAKTILKAQELLGDDPNRQRMNRIRVRCGDPRWNCAWTIKYEGGKVVAFERLDRRLTLMLKKLLITGK